MFYTHYDRCSPSDIQTSRAGYGHCRLSFWIESERGRALRPILRIINAWAGGCSRVGGRSIASAGQPHTSLWLVELRSGQSMWKTVAKASRIGEHKGTPFYHYLGYIGIYVVFTF